MSLPPGFLDELRSRVSLSQVAGRKVMWDTRKSNQAKGDMWAPCPFHQEKTASFHVDDRKGYYYCFGCHAKGDAISFVRETDNVSFMEAVEILARDAGMQVPARDPKAQAVADRRSQMADVMEQAVQFFRLQLKTAAGGPARDYLEAKRGLGADAWDRWEIGFAPDGWQALWDHLTSKNVAEDLILGAGLAKASTKGKKPYDTFRNRILFPIRDARGRAIAFGGRAMDPGDNAKYLNSPETELFDKGRSLFNHKLAREAAGKGQPLIVAEGYMDVIALAEAGFGASVAPLGTAVTEEQLRLLWRIAPEPIIALDGDAAGLRAAERVIDLAMPLLEAGQSLRFAIMPEAQDPDDVIRTGGAEAMQQLIDGAIPMVQLLWRRETEGRTFDSPERRAALDKALREAIKKIQDPSLRNHYGEAIAELRRELFRGGQGGRRDFQPSRRFGRPAPQPVQPSTLSSALAKGGEATADHLREAVILAVCVRHPDLVANFEAELENLELHGPGHSDLLNALLRDPHAISTIVGAASLEKLFSTRHVQIAPGVRPGADQELAAQTLSEELKKHSARHGHAIEMREAIEDIADIADERLTERLAQANAARDQAQSGPKEDKAEYQTSPNGARIRKDEKGAFDSLLDQISYAKGGRRSSETK